MEKITNKEAICTLTLFIMGTTLIVGIGGTAKNNAWIAGFIGMLMAAPMLLIYSRIQFLFPEKDLFEILNLIFGKVIGKAVSIIYIWYSFHLGALVLRNFGEFLNTVTLPETPMLVPMLFMIFVSILIVRAGVEVIGRFSTFSLPVLFIVIIIVLILGTSVLHWNHIKPILGDGLAPVLKGGFSAFSFPFAESVLFLGVSYSLKKRESTYMVYFSGILIAGVVIILLTVRNILILGPLASSLYFPSHVAVSMITIGQFIQRIEVTVAFVFVVGSFIKGSVCLFVCCKGIASLFNLKDYRSVVIQVGLLMLYLSYIIYDNTMLMRYWAFKVYPYYVFPFQVIIPVIIWIFAEIKSRRLTKS